MLSSGCDKVPLTAPAGTVITLVSTTSVLPINGQTDIVAVLIENGTTSTGTGTGTTTTGSAGTPVHNGTLVTFTSSLGRIEPAEVKTSNGRATATLIADGRSGRATVTAFSGSAKQTLEVVIGAAAAERVLVTATPTSVPAAGGSTTVTARVEDVSGNGLAGVPVAFSTTAGSLSSASVVTGEGGTASVTLSTTAAATVTASAGGKSGTAAIALRAQTVLTLTVPSSALSVGAAGTFTLTPSTGAIINNVSVNFDDGTILPLGTVTSATTINHRFADDGIFVVRVTGTDVDGSSVNVTGSVAVNTYNIAATASPASPAAGAAVTFTVTGVPAGVGIDTVTYDFGGGIEPETTNSLTAVRAFPAGTYNVKITVRPTVGRSKDTVVTIIVS